MNKSASSSSVETETIGVSTPSPAMRRIVAATVAVAAPILVVLAPLLIVGGLVVDLATNSRFRYTRLVAMATNALWLEWIGILMAGVLWIATGFGTAIEQPWSRRLHYRVQRWWAGAMFGAIQRWLGLKVRFDGLDLIDDSPVLIACQHASFFDALLPTVALAQRSDRPARHVLKRELAWDPCLSLFGNRHPNHFVTREGGERHDELAAIEDLAATAGDETLVIFPEGTFHSPLRAAKVDARLARDDPGRRARLDLAGLLPPRPGGITALLRGRPNCDVIFMAHVGLEAFGSLRSIVENVPFSQPVTVKLWRLPAAEIPLDPTDQMLVIDEHWQAMDDWISKRNPDSFASASGSAAAERSHQTL